MRSLGRMTLVVGTAFLGGCAVNGFSIENIEPPVGRQVRAEASQFNVFGFTPTSVEQISALRDSLSDQCDGGSVTGIVTQSSTIFVIIGVVEKSEVIGYCVES